MLTLYILEFLAFSFVGWIIDSGYRSITERKWVNAGYFRGPLCPIYGFGGLTLVFLFKSLAAFPFVALLLMGAVALILVEYLGGIFTEKALHVRLWDYSSSRFHIGGHVDALHSFYWVLLVALFLRFLFPTILAIESFFRIPESFDLPALMLFVLVSLIVTLRKSPLQYFVIKGKIMDVTVEKYRELFANAQRLSRITSREARLKLEGIIRKQLRNTGADLRDSLKR